LKRSVLVVDDSRAARELIAATLEGLQDAAVGEIEAVQCGSGFDALRLLPSRRFDLILTDINMPDIHGLELLRFVRQDSRTSATPVVVISTEASDRDIQRGLALGASGYLVKPFAPERLLEIAQRFLGPSIADPASS
jgi:two-component system, chemotaxis family, chemotaxis protein CheY